METRDEIKKLLGSGGMELEVFFGMWEGMMRTSSFVRDAFKGGMKTLERMAPTDDVRHVFGLLNALILDMEADAFADDHQRPFPVLDCPSGLEDLPPLPQFVQPRPSIPRFVKTKAGGFINLDHIESLSPADLGGCDSITKAFLFTGHGTHRLDAEELETLSVLLAEEALPLGRIEVTMPTEKGGE